jgi:hypothetical protein
MGGWAAPPTTTLQQIGRMRRHGGHRRDRAHVVWVLEYDELHGDRVGISSQHPDGQHPDKRISSHHRGNSDSPLHRCDPRMPACAGSPLAGG